MRISPLRVASRALMLFLLAGTSPLLAQGRGRIVGHIYDAATGTPLAGAQVAVVEQPAVAAIAALDGRFALLGVAPGAVSLRVRMIGYQSKVVTGLAVPDGGILTQDVTLSAQLVEVEAITVAAGAEAGSVDAALEKQRSATGIINAVSAEQIARSPDSDAGQAVQRVSGVSMQDGKFVFVRGLGERYTTTALNGARIPSPEPERRVVPLDLFPSGMLQSITTQKTFTPDRPGDFTGGEVDLQTREFPSRRVVTLSSTMGVNARATGEALVRAPTLGGEWIGRAGAERALPAGVAAAGDLTGFSDPSQTFPLIKSFRDVWSARTAEGPFNGGLAASVGGEDPVFGRMVGYLASFSYSNKQEVRDGLYQSLINGDGTTFSPYNVSTGSSSATSVLWGGLFNLSTRLGASSKLTFNNSLTRSADNEATELRSNNEEFSTPLRLTRLAFTTRQVRSDQLMGEHLLGGRHHLTWSATNSSTRRYEPDRSDIAYVDTGDRSTDYWFGSPRSATRSFSDLHESNWQLQGDWRLVLDQEGARYVKVGASWRATDRDAESRSYDLLPLATLSQADRTLPPELLFSDAHVDDGWFTLQANVFGGVYEARERLSAGYGMVSWSVGRRVILVAGARVERWDLAVDAFDPFGTPTPSGGLTTDLLPSLGVTVALGADQDLRISASQTVSRPEYRELAPIQYFEPLGGIITVGNPALERSLIQNYDARWEWFPRAGEVISAGVFYKRFNAPIERVFQFRGGTRANTWLNADGATNLGLELDLRKNLGVFGAALAPFSLASNVTWMRSRIEVTNDALTNTDRAMVGQAPYVANVGLTWVTGTDRPLTVSALYNVVGRRIMEAGAVPFPDTYEESRQLVDVSVEAPLLPGMQLKLDGKNLLDQEVRWTQGSVTRNRYRPGREFSLALRWGL